MKVKLTFLTLFITCVLLFTTCDLLNGDDNEENIEEYYQYEINIAYMLKYYEVFHGTVTNVKNVYVGPNEIEGQCSDYALMMAIEYNAEIVLNNQVSDNFFLPDGVYRLVGEYKNQQYLDYLNTFTYSGLWIDDNNDVERIGMYHPEIGVWEIELIESEKQRTITGSYTDDMHVWNRLNGIMLDAQYIDNGYKR